MKNAMLAAIIMLTGVSAMAQYYPGPQGGGYHHHRQPDPNDQASAMSAATGMMFLSLASMCASGPGCYYRAMETAKEEAAFKMVNPSYDGVYVTRALEILRQDEAFKGETEKKMLEFIMTFQKPADAAQ